MLAKAVNCFQSIIAALEAETLQGQTAARVVNTSKTLVQNAGLNLGQVATGLTPEQQQTLKAYFS